jgi:hypothetical protein
MEELSKTTIALALKRSVRNKWRIPMKQPKYKTDWILKYREHLQDLERVRSSIVGPDPLKQAQKLTNVFAPVINNPAFTAADLESVAEKWWSQERDAEIAAARKEVAIQMRLAPLYERLKTATSEEWEEYARLVSRTRFIDSPWLRAFAETGGAK